MFLYWGGLTAFLLLELRYSYRPAALSKLQRWLARLPLSIANGLLYHLAYAALLAVLLAQTDPTAISAGLVFWTCG